MSNLNNKEKLNYVLKFSKELSITAYEYGENTQLSSVGAHNILTGISKNPRTKNLDTMIDYINEKKEEAFQRFNEHQDKLQEMNENYLLNLPNPQTTIEEIIANMVLNKLLPHLKEIEKKLDKLDKN